MARLKRQGLMLGLICLSVIVGLAQGFFLLYLFDRYTKASDDAFAFEINRGEIARLDEVLTMSAEMHAATGDTAWRDRFLANVAPLDRALERAFELADSAAASAAIAKVADANRRLIAVDETSLALAMQGQLDQALELLTSTTYEEQKQIYQEGLNAALEVSRTHLQEIMESHRQKLLVAALILMINLLLVSELWRRLSAAEHRDAARQIRASLKREQRLSGLQRQFVSMLSHELRTPLAIIDGKAQRLRHRLDRLSADQIRASGETIQGSVRRLTDLMEGVLNVSRMEEGRIDVNLETFDLAATIEEVVTGYREVNPGRSITISRNDLPDRVEGDPRLLAQVVSNLVSNAVKYSDAEAPVSVESFLEGRDIVIAVRDQGVGIPADEIDNICERFFRASSSTGVAGTGIGLHFIKHLIDLHGGGLEIDSMEGVGSTFTVRLPHRPVVHTAVSAVCPGATASALSPPLSAA